MASTDFETGTSDPRDFTVDQVAAHLATASPAEFTRVQDLESGPDGKGRVGITGLTQEDAAATTSPADPDAAQVGDEAEGEDGYTRRVVSV